MGGGTPLRSWRRPGRGGAGPGQEEVSAPGHPPRGGFPESSPRERALALGPGVGRTGRKEAAARAQPQECSVRLPGARARVGARERGRARAQREKEEEEEPGLGMRGVEEEVRQVLRLWRAAARGHFKVPLYAGILNTLCLC